MQIRPDTPISDPRDDQLGFAVFAEALAEIIDSERTSTPLTIALSAPWGAGKTSVARMVETLLDRRVAAREGEQPRLTCWFNAWEHSDAPHLGAALAAKVAHTASRGRARWRRLLSPLPSAMLGPQERWRRRLYVALAAAAGATTLVLFHRTRDLAEHTLHLDKAFVGGLGWLGVLWVAALVWPVLFSAGKDAARFLDNPGSEAAKGLMSQVGEQLGELIQSGRRGGRMVIFVDDLERCPARRAVEVFEVASQLLAHTGVVTILLADMHALSDAARAAYQDESGQGDADLGRRYLEKLVQLELELPPPTPDSVLRLLEPERRTASTEAEPVLGRLRRRISKLNLGAAAIQSWTALVAGGVALAFTIKVLSGSFTATEALSLPSAVATSVAAAGLASAIASLIAALIFRQRQRERLKVKEHLRERVPRGSNRTEDLVEEEEEEEEEVPERLKSYAAYEEQSLQIDYSDEVTLVERFIRQHLPRTPRSAKRMLNHARLLTKIARDRNMFGGEPNLSPSHLGKWIVLRERWPHLAEALAAQGAPTVQSDDEILTLREDEAPEDQELASLLDDTPEIANVISRLVYFEAA